VSTWEAKFFPVGNVSDSNRASSVTIGFSAAVRHSVNDESGSVVVTLVEELDGVPVCSAHFDIVGSGALAGVLDSSLVASAASLIFVSSLLKLSAVGVFSGIATDKVSESNEVGAMLFKNRLDIIDVATIRVRVITILIRGRGWCRCRLGSRSWGRVNGLWSGLGSWLGSGLRCRLWGRSWA